MASLTFSLFNDFNATDVRERWNGGWNSLDFGTQLHGGYGELTMRVNMSRPDSRRHLRTPTTNGSVGLPLHIDDGGDVVGNRVWTGRVTDIGFKEGNGISELTVKGAGNWSLATDVQIARLDKTTPRGSTTDFVRYILDHAGGQLQDGSFPYQGQWLRTEDYAIDDTGIIVPDNDFMDKADNAQLALLRLPLADATGQLYYYEVWDDKVLYLRAENNPHRRHLLAAISDFEEFSLNQSLASMVNEAIQLREGSEVYEVLSDELSKQAYQRRQYSYGFLPAEVAKRAAVEALQAAAIRGRAIPQTTARMVIKDNVRDKASGELVPPHRIRAGDLLTIVDIGNPDSDELDQYSHFLINQTQYTDSSKSVTITPTAPAPRITNPPTIAGGQAPPAPTPAPPGQTPSPRDDLFWRNVTSRLYEIDGGTRFMVAWPDRNRYVTADDMNEYLLAEIFEVLTTLLADTDLDDDTRLLVSNRSSGMRTAYYTTLESLVEYIEGEIDVTTFNIRSLTTELASTQLADTDRLAVDDQSASESNNANMKYVELSDLAAYIAVKAGTLDIHEQITTQHTVLDGADRFAISDELTEGEPTKYATLTRLLLWLKPKVAFDLHEDAATELSSLEGQDRLVVSDESTAGAPNRHVLLSTLKAWIKPSTGAPAEPDIDELTSTIDSVVGADVLAVSDVSTADNETKKATAAQVATYVESRPSNLRNQASTLIAELHATDRMFVSDESGAGNPMRYASLSALASYFSGATTNIDIDGTLTTSLTSVSGSDLFAVADVSESNNETKKATLSVLASYIESRPSNLRNQASTSIGTSRTSLSSNDRMFISDESGAGNPMRYVSLSVLASYINNLVDIDIDSLNSAVTIADDDRFAVMDESASGNPTGYAKAEDVAEYVRDTGLIINAQTGSSVVMSGSGSIDRFSNTITLPEGANRLIGYLSGNQESVTGTGGATFQITMQVYWNNAWRTGDAVGWRVPNGESSTYTVPFGTKVFTTTAAGVSRVRLRFQRTAGASRSASINDLSFTLLAV